MFHYPTAGDSTLGKPVKREHSPEQDGEEQVSSKKIKLEDGANDVSFICFCFMDIFNGLNSYY